MLGIKINTGYLDLFNDTKASFQLNNPALSDGTDVGLATMPFSFPDTENNRVKTGFLKASDVYDKVVSYDAQLYHNGLKIIIGKLIITEVNDTPGEGSIEGFLSVNGFAADYFEKSLRELLWPVFTIGTTPDDLLLHALTKITPNPENMYCFAPLQQKDFYGDANKQFYDINGTVGAKGGIVNDWDEVAQSFIKNRIPSSGMYLPNHTLRYNKHALVPYVYIHYILRFLFGQLGFDLKGEFMDDKALQKLIFFNSFALDKKLGIEYAVEANMLTPMPVPFTVGTIGNDYYPLLINNEISDPQNVFDDVNGTYIPAYAGHHTGSIDIEVTFDGAEVSGARCFIEIMVGAHIIANDTLIFDGTNHVMNFTWTDEFYIQQSEVGFPVFFVRTAYNFAMAASVDVKCTNFQVKATDAPQLNVYNNEINLKNHVPDITISGLLDILRGIGTLGFDFDFSEKSCTINFCKNALGNYGIKRYTAKATRKSIIRFSNPTGYKMSFPFDGENFQPDKAPDISQYNYIGEFDNTFDLQAYTPVAPGDMALALNINWLFVCYFDPDPSGPGNRWKKLTPNYYPYIKGANPVDRIPEGSPLLMEFYSRATPTPRKYILPTSDESGTSTAFDTGDNTSGVKLAFYEGLQPDSNGDLYPLLTPYSRRYDGTAIGPYSLRWDEKARGLYDAFLRPWHLFLANTEEKETDLLMSLEEFSGFQFSYPIEINGVWYVVKQLQGDLTNKGLNAVKALIYRIMP